MIGNIQSLSDAQSPGIHARVGGHERSHGNSIFLRDDDWRFGRFDRVRHRPGCSWSSGPSEIGLDLSDSAGLR